MQKKRAWFHASSMTMDHGGGRFQDSNSWCESCASSKLGTLGLLLVVQVQTRYGWHHSVVRRLCACAVCRSYIQQPTTRLFLGLDKHRRKLGQLINNSTCIRTRQRKLLRRPGPRMMNAADRSNARARGQSRCDDWTRRTYRILERSMGEGRWCCYYAAYRFRGSVTELTIQIRWEAATGHRSERRRFSMCGRSHVWNLPPWGGDQPPWELSSVLTRPDAWIGPRAQTWLFNQSARVWTVVFLEHFVPIRTWAANGPP
jgi:hypothetical protein